MAIQPKDSCAECNIAFALAEEKEEHPDEAEEHKGKLYHPACWGKRREAQLRLLIRLNASRNIAAILRR